MLKETNELIGRAYSAACAHGFHDAERSVEHYMMAVIADVAGMVVADRYRVLATDGGIFDDAMRTKDFGYCYETYIGGTVDEGMATVCVRLYDLCGVLGIRFTDAQLAVSMSDDFSEVRGGGFAERAFMLCSILTDGVGGGYPLDVVIGSALCFVGCWADAMGIDLLRHIRMKMRYDELDSVRHGKVY